MVLRADTIQIQSLLACCLVDSIFSQHESFVCLSVAPFCGDVSVCLFVCLSVCLSVYLSVYLSVCLSATKRIINTECLSVSAFSLDRNYRVVCGGKQAGDLLVWGGAYREPNVTL